MRYLVLTLGRSDRGPFAGAVERYRKRLDVSSGGLELRALKASRKRGVAERRRADSATLAEAARGAGGHSVLLDERGRAFTSGGLLRHLTRLEASGVSRVTLMLGAADGVEPGLREGADDCWALSRLTLPHELALVVLLEQLYRLTSASQGHPYHRA